MIKLKQRKYKLTGENMFNKPNIQTDEPLIIRNYEHLMMHLSKINEDNPDVKFIDITIKDDTIIFKTNYTYYSKTKQMATLILQRDLTIQTKANIFKAKKCKYKVPNTEELINHVGNPIRNLIKIDIEWDFLRITLI